MKNILLSIVVLLLFAGQTIAQENKTITVSGKSTLQLSPNEIVLAITFGEKDTDRKQKVIIADIEKIVLQALQSAKVKDKNITPFSFQITGIALFSRLEVFFKTYYLNNGTKDIRGVFSGLDIENRLVSGGVRIGFEGNA